jgi:hypothetical protein
MHIENAVVEPVEEAPQEQKQEPVKPLKESSMKAVLIKKGEYVLSNSFVLPSFDVCLVGEQGTILVPQPNVLAIMGMGKDDIKCSKCGYELAMKVKKRQVQNLTIKCPSCNTLNEL